MLERTFLWGVKIWAGSSTAGRAQQLFMISPQRKQRQAGPNHTPGFKFFLSQRTKWEASMERTSLSPPGFARGRLLVFARRGLRYTVLQIPSFVVIY